jgi:retron-type reverse transcriptase
MINTSLLTGEFPSVFKTGCVIPIIKKPTIDADVLGNYRPITNLSFLSKVLERIVAIQLHDHLALNNLYPKLQSAYRKDHSTESALLKVQNDLLVALDNGHEALLVLLDFTAAFDTIDHNTLFSRLEQRFGLSGTTLKWIKSYLSQRSQYVSVRNKISSEVTITRGVAQGSVLGPLLFSLYISQLEDILDAHSLDAMVYADDTQIYVILKEPDKSTSVLYQ